MTYRSSKACPLPWVQLSILPDGRIRLCCHSKTSNLYKSDNSRPFYIQKDSLSAILNSDWLKKVKDEFKSGVIPKSCSSCFSQNAHHSDNPAEYYREVFGKPEEHFPGYRPEIKYLDLSLTRVCNLKCMMCSPNFSTGLESLYRKGAVVEKTNLHPFSLEFIESEDFNFLTKHLTSILLQGGEPFLSPLHRPILKKLVQEKRASSITLNYITNGTIFPQKAILDLWREFSQVNVEISLDDVGKYAEYIRYPLKWSQFEHNFRKLSFLNKSGEISLDTILTYQALNVFSLPRVFSFLEDYSVKSRVPIVNILEHPEFLNFRWLPLQVKEVAVHGLDSLSLTENLAELESSRVSFLKNKLLENVSKDEPNLKSDFIIHLKRTKALREGRGPELNDVMEYKF
jgi:MoaA/NifB/PqqE/SkfB family radical SAM enzyme